MLAGRGSGDVQQLETPLASHLLQLQKVGSMQFSFYTRSFLHRYRYAMHFFYLHVAAVALVVEVTAVALLLLHSLENVMRN
jgi:hypothetical protein